MMKKMIWSYVAVFFLAVFAPAAQDSLFCTAAPASEGDFAVFGDMEDPLRQRPEVEAEKEGRLAEAAGLSFYIASSEDEYAWPFLAGELEGKSCIYASNARRNGTRAEIRVILEANENQSFFLRMKYLTEENHDYVVISRNGSEVQRFSGRSDWKDCAVPLEKGRNEISIRYEKDPLDPDSLTETDGVYLADFRLASGEEVRGDLNGISGFSEAGENAPGEEPDSETGELVVSVTDEGVFYGQEENLGDWGGLAAVFENQDSDEPAGGGDQTEGQEGTYGEEDGSVLDLFSPDQSDATWRIIFLDQNEDPVPGCIINFCTDNTCMPVRSDAGGVAVFTGAPYPYHLQVVSVPEGYTFDTTQEFTAEKYGGEEVFEIQKD